MKDEVISLFDTTGNSVLPWAEAGYDCYCFDIQNTGLYKRVGDGSISFIYWDAVSDPEKPLRQHKNGEYTAFVSCFPPCTDLAVSGARWFKKKEERSPGTRKRAMDLVYTARDIAEQIGAPYYIENPVSVISSEWRKPDYSFHPYQFTGYCIGDNYTKKTCLWSGNGFVMPKEFRDEHLGDPDDRIHKAAPGPDRANFRSATPMGFAIAAFKANISAKTTKTMPSRSTTQSKVCTDRSAGG